MKPLQRKAETRRILLIGDSTMCDYSKHPSLIRLAPQEGWGMRLPAHCRPGVGILNFAAAGCSTGTFEAQGRWAQAAAAIREGDFVVIGMGINDAGGDPEAAVPREDFGIRLQRWIAEIRAKGGIPVLTTSTVLWKKEGRKRCADRQRKYNQTVLDTAALCRADFVDLCAGAFRIFRTMPNEDVCRMYMASSDLPGKKGRDFCHFNGDGAAFYAALFVQLCRQRQLRIGELFLAT